MSTSSSLPGTSGLPFVGETPSFLFNLLSFVDTRLRQYGPVFRTHLLRLPTLISCSYSATREICSMDASSAYKEFMQPLYPHPNLIVSAPGTAPREVTIQHFLPALSEPALTSYLQPVRQLVHESFNSLQAQVGDAEMLFKPYAWFKPFCERIVTRVLFGDIPSDLHARLRALASAHFNAVVATPVHFEMMGRQSARARGLDSYNRLIRLLQAQVHVRDNVRGGDNVLDTILQRLQKNEQLSEDMKTHLVHFMLLILSPAIPKSLASALASLCRRMSTTSGLQDRIMNGDLDLVLMETLRLDPPLPGGMRLVDNGALDGHRLKGRWRVWYSIRHANRDEGMYKDAERFEPERWRDKVRQKSGCPFAPGGFEGVPYSFGGGEKDCPGRDLAWELLKVVVSEFVQRFRVGTGAQADATRVLPVLRQVREDGVQLSSM